MTNPSSARFKALIFIVALAAVMALSATVAMSDGATCGAEVKPSTSSMSMPSTSSMAAPSMSAMQISEPGSGAASSRTQNAFLVKGDMNSNDVAGIHGVFSFGVHSAPSATVASAGFDYGLAKLHDPSDNSMYEVRFTGIDKSSDAKYGGVALLRPVFGDTGVGAASLPETLAYIAAWGRADLYKNGQRIASDVPAHVMVTPGTRDTVSGQLLAANNLDFSAREIMLHVPGPVEGLPDGKLLVAWPSATIALNDIGGRPLTQREVAAIRVLGETGVVAGMTAELPQGMIRLSLRNNGFNSTIPETLTAGYTRITVVNNSSIRRGVIIKARDVIGSPIMRYTPVLRPGQSFSFNTFLGSGSFTAMDYHGSTMRGLRHWRSHYQTSFSIGM